MEAVEIDERRVDERGPVHDATRATLRPGCDVQVIDLSAGGALVEARRPLRPGARVHVQLTAGGRSMALSAQVLRCTVWALDADGVRYRGALQFEDRWPGVREPDTPAGQDVPGELPGCTQASGARLPDGDRGGGRPASNGGD